jgi:hypothetical protein
LSEVFEGANVIEVTVRQNDRSGPRIFTKPLCRRARNHSCSAGDARIDEDPLPIAAPRFTEKNYVDDRETLISYVGRHLVHGAVMRLVGAIR